MSRVKRRICRKCHKSKSINQFPFYSKTHRRHVCQACRLDYQKQWELDNFDSLNEYRKDYRKRFSERNIAYQREYYAENKDRLLIANRLYYQENNERIAKRDKIYVANNRKRINKHSAKRRATDPVYKMRVYIPGMVRDGLKKNGGSKRGMSFYKAIGYTPQQLMDHLMSHPEKEPWMTRENRGRYIPETWDDNDDSTKTWQIDHIIPHSFFKHTSMEDDDFFACWDLSNLRPLNAKQNILDGDRREDKRKKKVKKVVKKPGKQSKKIKKAGKK